MRKLSLPVRLVVHIVLFSSIVTLIVTTIHLYFRFQKDVLDIHRHTKSIVAAQLQALSASLWSGNKEQVRIKIRGMIGASDISYIKLKSEAFEYEYGTPLSSRFAEGVYALEFPVDADSVSLGTLIVHSDTNQAYEDLWESFLYILITNFIRTLLVSLFMYWSFQVIITRPIKKLTEDTLKKIDSLDLNFQTLPEGENEIEKAFSKINMLIDKLHLSNQNMEQFCYSLSHDLKSPLVTILSFLELLELDLKEKRDMSAQNYLVPMRSAGDTMLKLLHETLELLRYGQVPMKIETLELRDIVLQALTLVEGSLMGSHIRVSVSDTLPTVQGDRTRLIKVFQNLLDNAIKFSPDHEDSLIEVGQISMKGIPVIYVRDQGKGIEAAYHEMIFGIFNVLDPTPDSTGIGLSIVKQIIDDHQWRIWADSEGLGKGTTFYIALGKEQTVLKKDYKK